MLLNGLELCGWSASETNSEKQEDERKEPCLMDIIRLITESRATHFHVIEQQKLLNFATCFVLQRLLNNLQVLGLHGPEFCSCSDH